MVTPYMSLVNVSKTYQRPSRKLGLLPSDFAVRNVNIDLYAGETLALVGESASGKSTVARMVVDLLRPNSGEVRFKGSPVAGLDGESLREYRRSVQIVFQDPSAAFNPRRTVFDTLSQAANLYVRLSPRELKSRVFNLLESVGLTPAESFSDAYSHQLSGGQRQRVMIARALAVEPKFIVADEPLSALDMTVQAQILQLLRNLREEFDIGYLLISHDLPLVAAEADRIAVMYRGRIVEVGSAREVATAPQHPYTKRLMESVLSLNPSDRYFDQPIANKTPTYAALQRVEKGCNFAPRCPIVVDRCRAIEPELKKILGSDNSAACHELEEGSSP